MQYRQPFKGEYPISQRFGEKITDPKGHTGIDYACPLGTPIMASEAGTVYACGWDSTGFGYRVILKHADGRATLYAHLSRVDVTLYELVGRGDQIGLSGSSGNSTGPHLHFEARRKWNVYRTESFDPMELPLMTVDDSVGTSQNSAAEKPGSASGTSQNLSNTSQVKPKLKEPDQLGENVIISAPLGAWAWSPDFGKRMTVYQQGTRLHYTGRTAERNGYTYCEVYPEPAKYWVAVHDGDTQILDTED